MISGLGEHNWGDSDCPPYGGKLVNLGKLSQMGISVPNTLYDLAVDKTAAEMASSFYVGAYVWVRRGTKIAVRSCGASEDGNLASFAGQYETVLNVPCNDADALTAAIQQCLDSRDTIHEYATQLGVDDKRDNFVVIYQPMEDFKISGIAFMGDPKTRDPQGYIIEAVSGLCDKLAGGEASPEVTLKGQIDHKWRSSCLGWGVRVDYVKPLIETQRWRGIVESALSHLYWQWGSPVDVEWGINSRGKLVIVQARPITGVEWEYQPGMGVGSGEVVRGTVRRVGKDGDGRKAHRELWGSEEFKDGEILVTTMTTPRLVRCMIKSAGIITEIGGETCHAAIVGRELGKPVIVGFPGAAGLRTGDVVEMDTGAGTVTVIPPEAR